MRKGDTRKEQIGYDRFWEDKKVTEEEVKGCAAEQCVEQCAGMEEVRLAGDTTEMN
jgi:hypothetical protein